MRYCCNVRLDMYFRLVQADSYLNFAVGVLELDPRPFSFDHLQMNDAGGWLKSVTQRFCIAEVVLFEEIVQHDVAGRQFISSALSQNSTNSPPLAFLKTAFKRITSGLSRL